MEKNREKMPACAQAKFGGTKTDGALLLAALVALAAVFAGVHASAADAYVADASAADAYVADVSTADAYALDVDAADTCAANVYTGATSLKTETLTADDLLPDSDELFAGYVEQLFETDDADSESESAESNTAQSSVSQSSAVQGSETQSGILTQSSTLQSNLAQSGAAESSAAQSSRTQVVTRQIYADRTIGSDAGLLGTSGESHLTDFNLALYTQLKAALKKIASGEESSSVVTVKMSYTYAELGVDNFEEAYALFQANYSPSYIFQYLLLDCPYDLYWFDKTVGVTPVATFTYNSTTMSITFTWSFPVAADYQGADSYTVNASKAAAAEAAAANAKKIVAAYAGKSDEEKLTAYKDEICALVSYEENYSTNSYGDVWELIYVFDGDDTTNVVCEGYSKAFQYLCDLSSFDDAVCYTVEGTMSGGTGAGGHMWNLVCLNGIVCMVDVTNSDEGTIGEDGGLFLVCADDATASSSISYSFTIARMTISYTYSSTMLVLYEAGIRTLGYRTSIASCTVTLGQTSYTYDGTAKRPSVTVKTADGATTLTSGTDYTVTYSNNKNAGTASVTVTGTGSYSGTQTVTFTINKANQTVTVAAGSNELASVGSTTSVTAETTGDGAITFASSNTAVATVNSSTGVVTAVAAGTATITATAASTTNYNSATASVTITVTASLAACSVSSVSNTTGGLLVAWNQVSGADGYFVYRTVSDGSYSLVTTITDGSTVSWSDTSSLTSGKDYNYKVTAYCTVANGTTVEGSYGTTKTCKYLTAGAVTSVTNVTDGQKVIWEKVSGANGYYVYRKVSGGSYALITTITSGSTVNYTDTSSHTSGSDYTYQVIPYFKNSAGAYTNGVSKTTKTAKYLAGGEVTGVTNTTSGQQVTWNRVSGANGYYVYRKVSGGSFSLVKTITSGSTVSWTDTSSHTSGSDYTYQVIPYFKNSAGVYTYGVSKTTKTAKYLTAGRISSLANTSSGITVSWSKVTGASGYYVYRKASGASSYTLIKTVTGNSTVSYTDAAVKSNNNTTYIYYVQPYFKNSAGVITKGAYTTSTTVRLVATSISSLTNSASKQMTVKWATASVTTGYQIQYSTSSSFSGGNTTVTVTGASTTSKVISSLTKGNTYYVRIRTCKTVNGTTYYSAWSTVKSVKVSK